MCISEDTRISRETLGRVVRSAFIEWQVEQGNSNPGFLLPYDSLTEDEQESERRIGEAVARHILSESCGCFEEVLEKTSAGFSRAKESLNSAKAIFQDRQARPSYLVFLGAIFAFSVLGSAFAVGMVCFANGLARILGR